ncbi:MAG: N-acetylmuramoyl-L-alanine amidase, partial [Clostridia bacterium]|nr:N-acetylmuramoyl-L-alanine amidase [Clostridia bacterium]
MRKKALKSLVVFVLVLSFISALSATGLTAGAASAKAIYTHILNRDNGEKTILSKKASYELKLDGATAVSGLADDGKKLTDGADGSYVGIQASGTGKAKVTINLGASKEALADFELIALNDSSLGAKLPASVKLSVSADGKTFVDVPYGGEIEKAPADKTAYTVSFKPTDGITAQYICFDIEFTGKLYIAETAVYTYLSVKDVRDLGGSQFADDQGIIYIIPDIGKTTAQVSGYFNQFSKKVTGKATTGEYSMCTTTNGSDAKSSATLEINEEDITEYYIGVGTEEYPDGVLVKALYLPIGARSRPGLIADKRYVVMHNTGSYGVSANGRNLFEYCFAAQTNRDVSWHYSVGTDGIYQQLPDNE